MFKGLGSIATLMKQAQQMQGKMAEMQEELAKLRVEGTAGGGMVVAEANGQQRLLSVRVDPSLLESGDREMLEDLTVAAVNHAMDKAKQAAADQMSELTGGMDLPGLQDALSKMGLGGDGA